MRNYAVMIKTGENRTLVSGASLGLIIALFGMSALHAEEPVAYQYYVVGNPENVERNTEGLIVMQHVDQHRVLFPGDVQAVLVGCPDAAGSRGIRRDPVLLDLALDGRTEVGALIDEDVIPPPVRISIK